MAALTGLSWNHLLEWLHDVETLRVEADPEAPAGLLEEELKQFEAKQRASFVE